MTEDCRTLTGTREALFDAALNLFAQKGFDGTTVDEIARAAGANKAMISYHFGGKDRLYEAILDEMFQAVSRRLAEVRDADLPAAQKLALYIRIFADLNRERPQFSAFVLREVLSGGAHIDDRLLPRFLFIFDCVRNIVLQGVREGTFRTVNPLLTHLGVVGAMVFFFASAPFRQRLVASGAIPVVAPDVDEFVAHLTQGTLRGLGKDKP
jgi:AcrR family transcriptional regulator